MYNYVQETKKKMPQFDITSFFPQITFFALIFLIFYVFLTKKILPIICQNLKINRKIGETYTNFVTKRLKDINLLSYIYKPNKILSFSIFKETIALIFLTKFVQIIIKAFISSINWLKTNQEKNTQVRLLKLNNIFINTLQHVYAINSSHKS